MARCRSTSFYLAPGVYRSFRKYHLVTRHPDTGEWVEITHRRDVHTLDEHPNWDHMCHVIPRRGPELDLAADWAQHDAVSSWYVDGRLIEGRRPHQREWTIHKTAMRGASELGGSLEVARAVLGDLTSKGAVKAAARWLDNVEEPSAQGEVLMFTAAAARVLDGDHLQALIARAMRDTTGIGPNRWDPGAPVNPQYLHRWDPERRLKLLADLWQSEQRDRLRDTLNVIDYAGVRGWDATGLPVTLTSRFLRTTHHVPVGARFRPDVLSAAATNSSVLAQLAFHPDAPASLISAALEDPTCLEDGRIQAPEDWSLLREDQLDELEAVLDELDVTKTHSSERACTLVALAGGLLSRRISRHAQVRFRDAVTAYTRCVRLDADWDELEAIAVAGPQLDADIANDLWKKYLDHVAGVTARQARRYGDAHDTHRTNVVHELLSNCESLSEAHRARIAADAPDTRHTLRPGGVGIVSAQTWAKVVARCDDGAARDATNAFVDARVQDLVRAWQQERSARSTRVAPTLAQWVAARHQATSVTWPLFHAVKEGLDPDIAADALDTFAERLASEGMEAHAETTGADPYRLRRAVAGPNPSTTEALREALGGQRTVLDYIAGRAPVEAAVQVMTNGWVFEACEVVACAHRAGRDDVVTLADQYLQARPYETDVIDTLAVLGAGHLPRRGRSDLQKRLAAPAAAEMRTKIRWPEEPDVFDLIPNIGSAPFAYADEVASLDGRTVATPGGERIMDLPEDQGELKVNANEMGNCTAGYAPGIRRGDEAIIVLRDPRTGRRTHNVELARRNGAWVGAEVNSPHNAGVEPGEAEQIRQAVLAAMRAAEPADASAGT